MIVVCLVFGMLNVGSTVLVRANFATEVKTSYDEMITTLRDRSLSVLIAMMNSINFIIYMILGKKFRANFFELFGCNTAK